MSNLPSSCSTKVYNCLSQVIESTYSILLFQMVATMVYGKVSGNWGQSKHRQQQQMISWITRKLCSSKSGESCSVITREMWSSEMTTAMSWRKRHLGDDASRMHACLKLGQFACKTILQQSYVASVPEALRSSFHKRRFMWSGRQPYRIGYTYTIVRGLAFAE